MTAIPTEFPSAHPNTTSNPTTTTPPAPIPPNTPNAGTKIDVFNTVFLPELKKFGVTHELNLLIVEKQAKTIFDNFAGKKEGSKGRGKYFASTSDPKHVEEVKKVLPDWLKVQGPTIKQAIMQLMIKEKETSEQVREQNLQHQDPLIDNLLAKYNEGQHANTFNVAASSENSKKRKNGTGIILAAESAAKVARLLDSTRSVDITESQEDDNSPSVSPHEQLQEMINTLPTARAKRLEAEQQIIKFAQNIVNNSNNDEEQLCFNQQCSAKLQFKIVMWQTKIAIAQRVMTILNNPATTVQLDSNASDNAK